MYIAITAGCGLQNIIPYSDGHGHETCCRPVFDNVCVRSAMLLKYLQDFHATRVCRPEATKTSNRLYLVYSACLLYRLYIRYAYETIKALSQTLLLCYKQKSRINVTWCRNLFQKVPSSIRQDNNYTKLVETNEMIRSV